MTTYRDWVDGIAASLLAGAAIGTPPSPQTSRPQQPLGAETAPKALIFAPHPDDEVIVGGLPLRLLREAGFAVTDIAVTLGSRPERRSGRRAELEAACAALGFGLVVPGLAGITQAGRAASPQEWARAVETIAGLLEAERPLAVFLPHAADHHPTHVGTHLLVTEAMALLPALDVLAVETEFWGAMATPNLMVESSAADVADLVSALALHAGEVARNPYHLRLPSWMIDNVRRGTELVGGQGAAAPDFMFATLYRLRAWREGGWREILPRGLVVAKQDELATLFGAAAWK